MTFRDLSQAELVALGKAIRAAEAAAEEAERLAEAEDSAESRRLTRLAILDRRAGPFRRWEAALVEAEDIATRRIAELSAEPEGESPGSAAAHTRRTNLDSAERLLDEIHHGAGGLRRTVAGLGIQVDHEGTGLGLVRTRAILAEIEQERAELEPAEQAA